MIRRFDAEVAGLPTLAVVVAERLGRPLSKGDFAGDGALIDYPRPARARSPRSRSRRCWRGKADPELLRGRVVVIGASAPTAARPARDAAGPAS